MRPLPAAGRPQALDRLADRSYDVLVVGGGVTGAGIALDAAARGLRVALVERDDLASGTSSRSSKLVHGGLRYLAHGDVRVVRESVVERDRLRRLAAHLVRPQRFVVTVTRREAPFFSAGLWVYRGLGGRRASGHRRLRGAALAEQVPGLARASDGGAFAYTDFRTDDARLVLQVARVAASLGADVLTRVEVVELRRTAGRVVGAVVRDRLGGALVEVDAAVTIAATGVWADRVRELAGAPPLLRPSKGVHLVFPHAALPVDVAVIVPSRASDHRMVFAIPWPAADGGQVVVGTTDTPYEGPLESPTVSAVDAAYCCAGVNAAFGASLRPEDAVGAWAGLRPLAKPGGRLGDVDSEALSRRHLLLEEPEGLVTVTGGKLTTYRRMAEDAVDAAGRRLGLRRRSSTAGIRLGLRMPFPHAVTATRDVCAAVGIEPDLAEHLVERYGDEAAEVAWLAAETGEAEPLVPGLPYLEVEARWAVERELALDVDDVLERRTRVSWRDPAGGGAAVERVAWVLGDALGWSGSHRRRRAERYLARVAAERGPVPLAGHGAVRA